MLDVDPINLNASCNFSQLVCSDLPRYPKKKLIVGGRCAGPPERNRFHLVQLAHGHSRRVDEVVSAFEQSLNAVLWHGSVEGRSDFLDEGCCCPNAGRFVFSSCDKPLISPWRSVHQIRNLCLGQLRGSVTDHGVWPRLLDDSLAFVPCAHDCVCSWLYLEPCERLPYSSWGCSHFNQTNFFTAKVVAVLQCRQSQQAFGLQRRGAANPSSGQNRLLTSFLNWKQRTQRPPRISAVWRRWVGFRANHAESPIRRLTTERGGAISPALPRVPRSNSLTIAFPVWDRTPQRPQASCTASASQLHFSG